ncbi:MAG: nicotinate-nucleotide--dimethylbenzimidazole phosphoribosyltransferase [Nanoarchaeota archaeon]
MNFNIKPVSDELKEKLQSIIDFKTKPLGSLGKLEQVALKICLIQNSLKPKLIKPTIIVFAGDHGIVKEGVSAYPPEVTFQMVYNFLSGGAAINTFCRQNGIDIKIVDAGVNFDFPKDDKLINAKIGKGTNNFLNGHAMSKKECLDSISKGAEIVEKVKSDGCNIIGFGDMGIGNTSSASIIMSAICDFPIENCVGKGTGLNDAKVKSKKEVLSKALKNYSGNRDPINILSYFGGFEIAMLCGAMLKAAELKMVILIDGFIVSSALLIASRLYHSVLEYCIFTHQSGEQGHEKMLKFLGAEPLVNLNMRLGEGTGVAVTYPIIESAVNFFNEMASFEKAGVNNRE